MGGANGRRWHARSRSNRCSIERCYSAALESQFGHHSLISRGMYRRVPRLHHAEAACGASRNNKYCEPTGFGAVTSIGSTIESGTKPGCGGGQGIFGHLSSPWEFAIGRIFSGKRRSTHFNPPVARQLCQVVELKNYQQTHAVPHGVIHQRLPGGEERPCK